MNILFLGDISARPGRNIVSEKLKGIKEKYEVDFVIANCENAAGGRGVTKSVIEELQAAGVDYFTSGDHIWDQESILEDLKDTSLPLVRPLNYENSKELPGKGYDLIEVNGQQILIINMLGQTFMGNHYRNPFYVFDEVWDDLLGEQIVAVNPDSDSSNPVVILDFHAEATAEKQAFGWYVKDKVNLFVGTHTHVATADTSFYGDMAYVTDAGMCGARDAALWVDYESVINKYKYPYKSKFKPVIEGPRIFNSVLTKFDGNSPISIERVDIIEENDSV